MLGFGRKVQSTPTGPIVNPRLCTDRYKPSYPHVGLFDCRDSKVWICKPLSGQAIRTAHARLITGSDNAVGTVCKDRFLCFWFYTPGTGEGAILGRKLDWEEGHLLVRIDPQWDYDRQRLITPEMTSQVQENLQRQFAYGQRILDFYSQCNLPHPANLHFIGQRADDSFFNYKRTEAST